MKRNRFTEKEKKEIEKIDSFLKQEERERIIQTMQMCELQGPIFTKVLIQHLGYLLGRINCFKSYNDCYKDWYKITSDWKETEEYYNLHMALEAIYLTELD